MPAHRAVLVALWVAWWLIVPPAGAADPPCPTGQTRLDGVCVANPHPAPRSRVTRGFTFKRSAPDTVAAAGNPLRPVRVYLRAADVPPAGVGAYGIVALRSKPTSASRARLLRLCQAFVTHLPRQDSMPRSVPLSDQMVTLWPLDAPEAPGAKADDCGFVIDHYDLYGGTSAIQDADRQGADLTGRGPFLIGWSPSSARGMRDKVVLVYDMSRYESQDSFDRAFDFWQDRIISDPKLWRNGWSWESIRLAVRDFFDAYGDAALKAIRLTGGGKE